MRQGFVSEGIEDGRFVLSYLSDHADILPEARRKALGHVLGLGEVVTAAAVQVQLQSLQEQGQLKDRHIRRRQGSFLKWSCRGQRQEAGSQRED